MPGPIAQFHAYGAGAFGAGAVAYVEWVNANG